MIRGGKIDVTILGTLEVSQTGDVSNWVVPGKMIRGMGGAMDLVAACKRVVIVTTHCTKSGKPKILKTNTLPLTGKGVANLIITELAVFEVLPQQGGLVLIEHAEGVSVDEIRAKTDADFTVADNVCVMQQ
jgi:3-oxoacid CoA-transferase subunit B